MSIVAEVSDAVLEAAVPPAPEVSLWRLSVEQYHEMVRYGILNEDDPVELLEGLLVTKMTKSTRHCLCRRLVQDALVRVAPKGWYADSQDPVTFRASEPEPDVVVVRGEIRDYADRHPGPADVDLVVEVADTSLRRDRGWKKAIYAEASVLVYWIVNLIDRRVEVYTDPTGAATKPTYRQHQDFGEADQVPVLLEGREVARIAVREILP
jgi:Uma2 family endonuclease